MINKQGYDKEGKIRRVSEFEMLENFIVLGKVGLVKREKGKIEKLYFFEQFRGVGRCVVSCIIEVW